MTRQRWFCCLCGALTARMPRPDGRALCAAHSTVALDTVPPDPLQSIPSMAHETISTPLLSHGPPAERSGARARTGSGDLPPEGEDAHPATGTESC